MTGIRASVQLRQDVDYRFAVTFAPDLPELRSDEPPRSEVSA